MDFELTDEQVMLRDTVRDLLGRAYDPETRLKVADTELGWSRDVWRQLAELGVLGLAFSEEDGGVGAGPVETMVVMEEIGRRNAPEPVIDAVLIPGGLVAGAGTAEQRGRVLPSVVGGETLLAFAHAEPGTRWPATELATTAVLGGDTYRITGVKNPVPHGDCADQLVVSAALPGGGIGLFLVAADAEGVTRTAFRTFDERRGAQIEFGSAAGELLGDGGDAQPVADAVTMAAQASLCAESLGAMEEALRLTTEYLKTRKQFGVTLSKFQTLSQRAANMYVSLELARSMSLYATAAVADGSVDQVAASRARLQVGRSARHIGQESIQMHGGIGITTEYPVSHYVARLTAIARTLGGDLEHLRVLTDRVGDYTLVEF
ncbi:acyl-CoA dehydrogenase family protein [Nocardia seriolae]|uniref:Acyl-CoA dehydrogenase n=1 Tax=Nocardia seriolae TaxID=37332 RepID=A0A0B8N9F2_9NOCA|nr:acyl-CoA dehydrogenase family protein [Nocardia seriolae]APA96094.1 Isovaleryl-CoA dehydrogenase, mitochondrial [Nocardia seriolae]MTJ65826.1 acyl-CoA dehydrogenase [Nocardia seriolae]MTJ75817.1 acyl-CoA dehydrogenase [Nocardia seriolae]MTJ86243.1 acyl-CoA dehydrogenase [Nocardia seriolae]MTK30239.1 acyl-CoA dehydrogenase [Nocardia seriolae]